MNRSRCIIIIEYWTFINQYLFIISYLFGIEMLAFRVCSGRCACTCIRCAFFSLAPHVSSTISMKCLYIYPYYLHTCVFIHTHSLDTQSICLLTCFWSNDSMGLCCCFVLFHTHVLVYFERYPFRAANTWLFSIHTFETSGCRRDDDLIDNELVKIELYLLHVSNNIRSPSTTHQDASRSI